MGACSCIDLPFMDRPTVLPMECQRFLHFSPSQCADPGAECPIRRAGHFGHAGPESRIFQPSPAAP